MKYAALYLVVGVLFATKTRPVFSHNWWVTSALWPWPVSAHAVYLLTGKYPRWTPP